MIDWTTLLVALLAAVAAALAFALLRGRRGGAAAHHPMERLVASQTALEGRLAQMAEQTAAAQQRLAESLQTQERQLSQTLNLRLEAVSQRVTESLQTQHTRTGEVMGKLHERLAVIDAAQKNIAQLSTQMVGLQDILSNKQARGAFGEIQLKDLVESVLPPSAYEFQATLSNRNRADCLIRLPNPPGPIAIDSKFPLEGYQALRAAETDEARRQATRLFETSFIKHIRDIAGRYIITGETAESALMFVPSEAVYAELHANFQKVVEESYRARVYVVSPTTLWATLNTIRAVLKDVRMREQAGLIQKEVETMMLDVDRLHKRVGNLQRHFRQAEDDLGEIATSASKVASRGETILDIELAADGNGDTPRLGLDPQAAGPAKPE
ncbi:MAG: DNA recombination protein RmuC [Alphaproteobacteria bacterium]